VNADAEALKAFKASALLGCSPRENFALLRQREADGDVHGPGPLTTTRCRRSPCYLADLLLGAGEVGEVVLDAEVFVADCAENREVKVVGLHGAVAFVLGMV